MSKRGIESVSAIFFVLCFLLLLYLYRSFAHLQLILVHDYCMSKTKPCSNQTFYTLEGRDRRGGRKQPQA